MWFTENPWPPMFLLGAAAIALGGLWATRKRGVWLVGVAICLLAAVGIYFFEKRVITERERVTASLLEMAQAFQRKDAAATLGFISNQAPEVRELVMTGLELVDIKGDLSIKGIEVEMHGENSQADAVFRANGTATLRGPLFSDGASRYVRSRWLVRWQKEAGEWKVIETQRLNLEDNEPMPPFEARR